jgi:hypothetical protein
MEAEITLNVWGTRTGRRVFYDALRLRLRLRLGSFRAVFSRRACRVAEHAERGLDVRKYISTNNSAFSAYNFLCVLCVRRWFFSRGARRARRERREGVGCAKIYFNK